MATKLDVINAHFIGFRCGKWHGNDITFLIEDLNLTKKEWLKLKEEYPIENDIDDDQIKEIDEYFKI